MFIIKNKGESLIFLNVYKIQPSYRKWNALCSWVYVED